MMIGAAQRKLPIRFSRVLLLTPAFLVLAPAGSLMAAPAKTPDVIVFTNGDQLTGTFVREVGGTVTFHSDIAGDINVTWDKIKELKSASPFAVLEKGTPVTRKTKVSEIPTGAIHVEDAKIELESSSTHAELTPIPEANASYIIDQGTLDKQMLHAPGFFSAWNGSATAGLTVVKATQNQYTFNTAVALARVVPTVAWLPPRNRTTVDFASSYGKITEPSFTSGGVFTPETSTKSNIIHGDAERDEYFSERFYYLGQLAYDHNYSQSLQLQQIYGGGIGWTVFKHPKDELDLKATLQYEKQHFFDSIGTTNADTNLIGSTIAANYALTLPRGIAFAQELSYIPAFNDPHAYSFSEFDTLTFPAYKSFGFTVGSIDSYLNNVPLTEPPTKRNSFQFTMGVTYTIKSKY